MLEPRILERKFRRSVKNKGYFLTASGCINYVQVEKGALIISSTRNDSSIHLKNYQIRKAIRHLQVYRTAVRKDMEQFSNFSSALFGILVEIFKDESKLQALKHGLFRLTLLGVRFYAGGLERDPFLRKEFKELGGQYVLFNYYQLKQCSFDWLQWLESVDAYCLIDSGAFSYFQKKNKEMKSPYQQQQLLGEDILMEQYIYGYAGFINKYKEHRRIIGFFPFDVIGDPVQTKENERLLRILTDAKIFPVWQFTDRLDELKSLVDGEPEMIGIGGTVPFLSNRVGKVRAMLNTVFHRFPDMNFHLLGIANELLLEFPCFSSDSTAFLNARKSEDQRKVYEADGTRIAAPKEMTTLEIIQQNLRFLINLENEKNNQLTFMF
ncbi:hypothetical protein ACFWGC_26965 [Cytobacillus pseudoceanisediminis]|uniref:hypothetical protein n=1 Tax=Cytobacillus pseudoceanisediminis TaxID=3051614 RepID=UPI0036615356